MVLELVPKETLAAGDMKRPTETHVYKGPERRKEQRRTLADRRDMVRFETKTDRRARGERRNTLGLWRNRDF